MPAGGGTRSNSRVKFHFVVLAFGIIEPLPRDPGCDPGCDPRVLDDAPSCRASTMVVCRFFSAWTRTQRRSDAARPGRGRDTARRGHSNPLPTAPAKDDAPCRAYIPTQRAWRQRRAPSRAARGLRPARLRPARFPLRRLLCATRPEEGRANFSFFLYFFLCEKYLPVPPFAGKHFTTLKERKSPAGSSGREDRRQQQQTAPSVRHGSAGHVVL